MQFLDKLRENTLEAPDKVALEFLDPPLQRFTFAELDTLIQKCMVYLLEHDIQPGDRVAIQLPKCIEFIILHLATIRIGAITLPLNPAYPPTELVYFLNDSEARFLFADESDRQKIEKILNQLSTLEHHVFIDYQEPSRFQRIVDQSLTHDIRKYQFHHSSDTTVLMIYTSGTTGKPKGALITTGNLTSNLDALHSAWGWLQGDVLLHVLPMFHVHGLITSFHGALHAGATTLAFRKFDARPILQVMADGKCSVFMAVPTIYQRILSLPDANHYDISKMRLLTSGSDRLPDEIFITFQETFGHTLLERYGMTETGMNISNPLVGERRRGSVGLPLPGVEVRIVDPETETLLPDGEVGEVQIRGPNVFKGYWRQPEKTTQAFSRDGWLKTGDLGMREPDGYFSLKGRAKDLIITGGLNVYPPEVERVLNTHEAVKSSAVIGCADPDWGERVVAIVVIQSGSVITAEDLITFTRENLAAYKCPKEIIFAESLPRNAMGKVQKAKLRQDLCG